MSTEIQFNTPALPTDAEILAHPTSPDIRVSMYLQKEACRPLQALEVGNILLLTKMDTLVTLLTDFLAAFNAVLSSGDSRVRTDPPV